MAELQVLLAQPFMPGETGAFGKARYMLFQQQRFPLSYDPDLGDLMVSADSDRIRVYGGENRWKNAVALIPKNTGQENFYRNGNPRKVKAFVKAILDVDNQFPGRRWTGFRILVTINRSNGYPIYSYQLFSKGPKRDIPLYSGDHSPNVEASFAHMSESEFHRKMKHFYPWAY